MLSLFEPKTRQLGIKRWALYLTYSAILALCIAAYFSLAYLLLSTDKNRLQREFTDRANNIEQNLRQALSVNETILDGFAAFTVGEGEINNNKMHLYADSILQKYSHVYMFQAAQYVARKDINRIEKEVSQRLQHEFFIWYFDGRLRHASNDSSKRIFYPVLFVEPTFSQQNSVLGLDLQSMPFVQQALQHSIASGKVELSQPIDLFEGERAIVMLKPSYLNPHTVPNFFTLLIMKTEALRTSVGTLPSNMGLYLSMQGNHELLSIQQQHFSNTTLLGAMQSHVNMTVGSQDLALRLRRPLQLHDISLFSQLMLLLITGTLMMLLIFFMHKHFLSETQKESEHAKLFKKANFDALTGLANRHYFFDRVERAIATAKRRSGKLAFLYFDLNNFKPINDQLGHQTGDAVLAKFAGIISQAIRSDDLAARLGGDEFILLLENVQLESDPRALAQRIQDQCRAVKEINTHSLQLNCSVGIALFPEDGDNAATLLHVADQKMYQHKQALKEKTEPALEHEKNKESKVIPLFSEKRP